MFDLKKTQSIIEEDSVDGDCEKHGKGRGLRVAGSQEYRCEKCLAEEISDASEQAITSGQAIEMLWSDD